MNAVILKLEKRKNRVLKLRNDYIISSDKDGVFTPNLKRYDDLIDKIVKQIKIEWSKLYKR